MTAPQCPLVVAYGMGVDSTAMLVGMQARGIRPDLILFADTGSEKPETYAYLPIIQAWLHKVGFPEIQIVRYVLQRPRDEAHVYATLEENCLVNETLPSLAFGRKACSMKWKRQPQDKFVTGWPPAKRCWAAGGQITKAIGYDSGKADSKRAWKMTDDAQYHYWYPLRDWGWDREECKRQIAAAGLPVPPKSACFFCPASKPQEIIELTEQHPELADRIIEMERRAAPNLRNVEGLWRSSVKGMRGATPRPGAMTPFIQEHRAARARAEEIMLPEISYARLPAKRVHLPVLQGNDDELEQSVIDAAVEGRRSSNPVELREAPACGGRTKSPMSTHPYSIVKLREIPYGWLPAGDNRPDPPAPRIPVVVAYGGGLDSFCMIVEGVKRGERIDTIAFVDVADTKHEKPGEWPSTYRHIREVVEPFARRNGIPFVWINSECYPVRDADSLHGWLEERGQIPVAGPGRLCTIVAKVERFEAWLDDHFPDQEVVVWVGFEAGEEKRAAKDPNAGKARAPAPGQARRINRFPLIEWGLCRCRCASAVSAEGYPVPRKSACVFCPYGSRGDWQTLQRELPEQYDAIVALEANKPLTDTVWRDEQGVTHHGKKLSIMGYRTTYVPEDKGLEDRRIRKIHAPLLPQYVQAKYRPRKIACNVCGQPHRMTKATGSTYVTPEEMPGPARPWVRPPPPPDKKKGDDDDDDDYDDDDRRPNPICRACGNPMNPATSRSSHPYSITGRLSSGDAIAARGLDAYGLARAEREFRLRPDSSSYRVVGGPREILWAKAGGVWERIGRRLHNPAEASTYPVERFGMVYSPDNERNPKIVALKSADWSNVPEIVFRPSEHVLHANEASVKAATVDKVASGQVPFREGYEPKFVILPGGAWHVIDGHHRVAMHSAAGHHSYHAQVLDLRASPRLDNPAPSSQPHPSCSIAYGRLEDWNGDGEEREERLDNPIPRGQIAGRPPARGTRIDSYRNLNVHDQVAWSLRDASSHTVTAVVPSVILHDVQLHVSEAGRQRVLREKRKNVHAWVSGEYAGTSKSLNWRPLRYNPYKLRTFIDSKTKKPIHHADYVKLSANGAYYANTR